MPSLAEDIHKKGQNLTTVIFTISLYLHKAETKIVRSSITAYLDSWKRPKT